MNPQFLKIIEQSRNDQKAKGEISSQQMRQQLKLTSIQHGTLAAIIVIGGCFIPIPSQAAWYNDIPGVGQLVDVGKKLVNGDFKGAGEAVIAPVKKVLTGIKTLVTNPGLLIETTKLAAQCAPKIVATAAAGAGASLLVQDFLADGPCTQFNRICSNQMGDLVCPNIDGLRSKIVAACQEPSTQQAIAGTKASQYCAGTVANNGGGRFSQSDQAFGSQPNAQDMQVAQVASTFSADDIIRMNAQQMTQLLQMHQEEFNKLTAMNENQRKDFIAELDKQRDSFERIINVVDQSAKEGRKLDHEIIMELITGSQEEREKIYHTHKEEIDRLVNNYNEKLQSSQMEREAAIAERDAAVKKVTEMMTSLNRQLLMAQFLHVACSRSIDDYTFCAMIRYKNSPEKCIEKENKKRVLCE